MAEPCPEFDEEDFLIIFDTDCATFETLESDDRYKIIEDIDCEAFDEMIAESGDVYRIWEFDSPISLCECCQTPCCGLDTDNPLFVTFSGCPALNGTYEMIWDEIEQAWIFLGGEGDCATRIAFDCDAPNTWVLNITWASPLETTIFPPGPASMCEPFLWTATTIGTSTGTGIDDECCYGLEITAIVTEAAP